MFRLELLLFDSSCETPREKRRRWLGLRLRRSAPNYSVFELQRHRRIEVESFASIQRHSGFHIILLPSAMSIGESPGSIWVSES